MQSYLTRSINMGAAMLLLACVASAQTAQPAGTNRDFSGLWTIEGVTGLGATGAGEANARDVAAGRVPRFVFTSDEPPMQPWAVERYKLQRLNQGPGDGGNDSIDSIMYPYCMPEGLLRSYTITPFEIVHGKDVIIMLFERNHQTRRIFMDGKKHLEGYIPSFMGTAHGRWEEDTLVVETDNFEGLDGYNTLDTFGHPMTDQLRVTERISRPAHDTLRIEFTSDDPGAYTRPWGGTKIFTLKPDWEMIEEIVCSDHLREDYIRDMQNNTPRGTP